MGVLLAGAVAVIFELAELAELLALDALDEDDEFELGEVLGVGMGVMLLLFDVLAPPEGAATAAVMSANVVAALSA